MRNQKGITLVALVITIIVLLILAAVTIAALGGQNGILTNASRAQVANELGEAQDLINLTANEAINEYYTTTYVNGTAEVAGSTDKQSMVAEAIDSLTLNNGTTKTVIDETTDAPSPDTPTGKKLVTVTSKNGKGKATAKIDENGTLSSWTVTIND